MEFKDKLKSLRKENNLTQEALSSILHVSRSLVAKWENGLGLPSEDTIKDICNYFNISEDKLFDKTDSLNVIVDKNIKIKKKNIIIAVLAVITGLLLCIGLVNIIAEQVYYFNTMINQQETEELIDSEEIKINKISIVDNSFSRQWIVDRSRNEYYVLEYINLVINIDMNETLYDSINLNESKIKFSIYDDYINLYTTYTKDKFYVTLEANDYDVLKDVYIEEILINYNVKTIEENEIVTKLIEKSYKFNKNTINTFKVYFVKDFSIDVDISIFDKYLITFTSIMESNASDVINNNVLDTLIDYKIKELEEKYLIEFKDDVNYDLSSGVLGEYRYQDYNINIYRELKKEIELEFSKDVYNLTLEKGKELEIEISINNIKCDDFKVSLYDSTNKISGSINAYNNIVLVSNEVGVSKLELFIDLGFVKFVYNLSVNIV